MRIGIIGSGNMGRAIGVRWAEAGHEVAFGARQPEQARRAASRAGYGSHACSIDEAASFGLIVLWTTRIVDAESVLTDPFALANKVVIDINNRDFRDSVAAGELPGISLAERLQSSLPHSAIVKALNTIPKEIFDCDPAELRATDAQTFIAGADRTAKAKVTELVADLGFRTIDLGEGPVSFRAAEALGDVIRLVMAQHPSGILNHLRLTKLPAPTLESTGERHEGGYH